MTEIITETPIEEAFRSWTNQEREKELASGQNYERHVIITYLYLMSHLPFNKINERGDMEVSLKDILDGRMYNLPIMDPENGFKYGSILAAKDWSIAHPESGDAKLIRAKGFRAPFRTHLNLFISMMNAYVNAPNSETATMASSAL